jgi:hypothetical protein
MIQLRAATTVTLAIGPFLDDTDGKTAETALSIAQADVRLSKNGAAFAQKGNATSCTHMENGYYSCPLSTTDTGTVGILKLAVAKSGALPVFIDMMIIPAVVYDSLVEGTDNLQVDLTQIDGLTTAGNNATLNLKKLNIVNSSGDAIVATGGAAGSGINATGGATSGHGISAKGNGNGDGLHAEGGATATNNGIKALGSASGGDGIAAIGAGSSGHGAYIKGSGDSGAGGAGVMLVGVGANAGLHCQGGDGASTPGAHFINQSTTGAAIRADASGVGNSTGLECLGAGTGAGLQASGGASAPGLRGSGGVTTGPGAKFEGATSGHGLECIASSTSKHGIYAAGGASGGTSHGIRAQAYGTGSGLSVNGGNDGHGINAVSGGVSGDGIRALSSTGLDISAKELVNMPQAVWAYSTRTLTSMAAVAGDVWNALTSSMTTVGSIGKKLADWVLGSDSKVLISVNAQDLSTTLDVNTKTITANAITATAIASNAIAATKIASGAITSAKFASGAIDATAIATDAIGSAEFSQAAADKVWSSAARTLTSLGSSVVAEIWSALTSGMSTAGSIGKKLADWALGTDSKVLLSSDAQDLSATLSVNTKTITAGAVNAAAVATGAIDADALATSAVDEIVDTVWEEASASHLSAGTMGKALADAGAGSTLTKEDVAKALKDQNVSGTSSVTGSVYKDIQDNIDAVNVDVVDVGNAVLGVDSDLADAKTVIDNTFSAVDNGTYGLAALKTAINEIISKLPAGSISGLSLTDQVDGVALSSIFELTMAMVNGRYRLDYPSVGQVTFYKRNNSTVLFTVNVSETERSRV